MSSFDSVLIANRGEIACRIIRTCKALGYRTVAVYSDADSTAPHTILADQFVHIDESPVGQSYLVIDKILKAAKQSGAQAIHPGYGFLSENDEFSSACQKAGLIFIGPSAHAISVMGNKAESKRRMMQAKVPCIPGYEGENQEDEVLLAEAEKIGVPIMVKAAAGGGGRGMRLVHDLANLANAITLARSEAQNAFGSGELILERAITEPRHVEIQIFADQNGNTIYLGERDCSIQRRHQKVVEEAPCPVMTESLRKRMGESAVVAAKSIDYVGAGTVEFLLDAQGEYYFLEMNTRLQVEHPVTELITGLDLVALQLQVAQGDALGISQDDVCLRGHAIEARLYSEDPSQDFLPATGVISRWQAAEGEGIRVDSGIESGYEISPYYDAMVAKVIAHGTDRETARRRLVNALQDTVLFGVKNNKGFLIDCLQKQSFIEGTATTAFINQEFSASDLADPPPSLEQVGIAAVLQYEQRFNTNFKRAHHVTQRLKNWSSTGRSGTHFAYQFEAIRHKVHVCPNQRNRSTYRVEVEESNVLSISVLRFDNGIAQLCVDDTLYDIQFMHADNTMVTVAIGGDTFEFVDQIKLAGLSGEESGSGKITAPMHGLVLDLMVETGQSVSKGQVLLVLEAMKMQHQILSQTDGLVRKIHVKSGMQVGADENLIEIEVEEG